MLVLIRKPILKRIKSRMMIDIPVDGHYVRCAESEKRITFLVTFTRPYPTKMKITRIDYQVSHDACIIQHGYWDDGIILDKNNLRETIPLCYNPLESPSLMSKSKSGWKISGTATIVTIYGMFKSSFESTVLNIHSEKEWEVLIKECKDATS